MCEAGAACSTDLAAMYAALSAPVMGRSAVRAKRRASWGAPKRSKWGAQASAVKPASPTTGLAPCGMRKSAVAFDAVQAGRARGADVVMVDTAGRLPTQLHLMEELKKIKRVVQKADASAPHEVLLVIDGNTGQNALAQVKAFDEALQLTGLIVTKLDGTAKGGVLCAIAREKPIPVYFIGVGEKLEDLETFDAREFAQALLD